MIVTVNEFVHLNQLPKLTFAQCVLECQGKTVIIFSKL